MVSRKQHALGVISAASIGGRQFVGEKNFRQAVRDLKSLGILGKNINEKESTERIIEMMHNKNKSQHGKK